MRSFANFAGFQLAWWASVLGAARGAAWIGVLACSAFVALQWIGSSQRRLDARLVACALLLGIVLDGALGQLGWIVYRGGEGAPVPAWIVALWGAFAMTLTHSLGWLRPGAAFLLGAIGGPLAYLGAARLGAVELVDSTQATIALAIGWAVATCVLTLVARHARGTAPVPPLAMGGSR
ncbi:DUF2878 domain-containing protein [Lysobacter auxotrophicus]|uniref:DUF2878 domain-containing protein n=1 Tax=Lysobacter auxotrophicus TaxID=2992573 RepID=A0ABM8DDH2_9GAMM|nr:DUF2878 domain-containing protein [Lysobacter auxotrophicus]BDU16611.1 DUF2878 domain-containing protein [Lysobacter auxotrophicus]